ncbi:hypothetical protein BDA96_06G137100 [Sorghum bicolor]|uniref:Uncharacterized protein n=2 Tax=Sorghum bicolor TaxID=4558 RepID=C5YAU7_SORBI|nr:hypothetical protein SORBI_3006G124200 [Sorghum bicolor]KAG0526334.1 hypothetical protein BDA96_06G137100 [Sorghum bicolor]
MVSLGIVRLVALVLLVVFSSSLHQQAGVGAIRLHDRRQHAQQWVEERNQLRSYMTMDYAPWHRRVPKHN